MSDFTPTSDPAPSESPAAPAPASPALDVLGASATVANLQRAQAPQAEPAAPAIPDFPKFSEGQLVRHTWTDPHGPQEAYGLVLAVHSDPGAVDRVEVLWINSSRSGAIPATDLEDPNAES